MWHQPSTKVTSLSLDLSNQVFIYSNADLDAFVTNQSSVPTPPVTATRTLGIARRDVKVFAVQDDLFVSVGGQDANLTYYGTASKTFAI